MLFDDLVHSCVRELAVSSLALLQILKTDRSGSSGGSVAERFRALML